jgi:glycosyltransferase involved in cell wall biosynthesis
MKLKRLLIIAPSYHPNTGGVETHIRHVVSRLIPLGYQPLIIVRYDPSLPADYRVDGTRVIRCPRPGSWSDQLLWLLRYLPLLLRTEVVHTHDFFPLQLHRLLGRRRWVHTFHGYEGYPLEPGAIAARQEVRRLVSICVGVGEFIEKWYGTPCEAWLYGAVDGAQLPPPKPAKWDLIFYGRLEEDTGFKGYLTAFAEIRRHDPKVRLVVVGSGGLQSWAEGFSTEHHLDVTFVAATAKVLEYAVQARVCFVSGYLAILEAAAMGKPVIALYETPLKHDYLTCHPMAKRFEIVGSAAEVAAAYSRATAKTPAQLGPFRDWALQQTWERIAHLYADFYQR